jgi:hypothetical protein
MLSGDLYLGFTDLGILDGEFLLVRPLVCAKAWLDMVRFSALRSLMF